MPSLAWRGVLGGTPVDIWSAVIPHRHFAPDSFQVIVIQVCHGEIVIGLTAAHVIVC